MDRIGSLLVFKPEVTEEEAVAALESIRHLLDVPQEVSDTVPTDEFQEITLSPTKTIKKQVFKSMKRPFVMADRIHHFNDHNGTEGPVWYIP